MSEPRTVTGAIGTVTGKEQPDVLPERLRCWYPGSPMPRSRFAHVFWRRGGGGVSH